MGEIQTAIMTVINSGQMKAMIVLLIAALVLGVASAIKSGTFKWSEFGKFVPDKIWPLIAWVVVAVIANMSNEWAGLGNLVYAGIIAIYTKGILGSVKLLTGLDIPKVLS